MSYRTALLASTCRPPMYAAMGFSRFFAGQLLP